MRSFALIAALAAGLVATAQTKKSTPAEIDKRVEAILAKMTLEDKVDYIGGVDEMFIRALPQYGIPRLKMSDGPLGVRTWGPSTAYPAGIAMAASWDAAVVERVGTMLGRDARARGVNFLLAPGVNIYRAPMNGRNFEYFGEDPYLASRMAVAYIEGVQSQSVIATVKHYIGNNSEWGRMRISSDIDERTMREIYLPAFEAAVKEAKVGAIMDAYNLVNGLHMTENGFLNIGIAKQEWGFDGILMSDWGATHTAVAAADAGLDLEMPSGRYMNRTNLLPAIKQGAVTTDAIDDKVRRILRKAIQFGFFDRDQTDKSIPLDNPAARAVALEAARGSMVLLKNEGNLLPLQADKLKTIAVIGPNAAAAVTGGGGSSQVQAFSAVSFLDGVKKLVGTRAEVIYASGLTLPSEVSQTTQFFTEQNRQEPGLKGEYFDRRFQGSPALVRTDRQVHFRFTKSYKEGGAEHFVVRWTGYYFPVDSGGYAFHITADNGYRIYVDDKLIAQKWYGQPLIPAPTAFAMQSDAAHKIVVEAIKFGDDVSMDFGIAPANNGDAERAKDAATKADVVILCVGFDASTEGEGADRTFGLPPGQDALIRYILAANKKTVVVLTAGGAVDMTAWIEHTPALIHTWYPGEEGGTALAQILFGQTSPSGKLPASFEKRWEDNATFNSYLDPAGTSRVSYSEGVFLGYRHFDKGKVKPLFPFGYGLSYTTFQYANLRVAPASGGDALAAVSFDVKNTGGREGAEIAELYVGDKHSKIERPVKELKGFAKVSLKPGETKTVRLTLDRRAFSYFDPSGHKWKAEPGEFSILVGGSSAKIELEGKYTLEK
ncbi:MAG TPA: glycoside hydrolase family 3 C-terminal domain-containing protein [Bryobacteraceae bacterium]|nr:glycoside hydrolase family 3 C-terminal domain-containing protein [Bryobacteraceae bacterium]